MFVGEDVVVLEPVVETSVLFVGKDMVVTGRGTLVLSVLVPIGEEIVVLGTVVLVVTSVALVG